jgi:uncharacterized protein (TIGR01777 family)
MTKRKLIIPGGNGFLGRAVAKYMSVRGWNVIVLSRDANAIVEGARTVAWDGQSLGEWCNAVDGAAAVLNLAGRHVNCRYHARNRREIEQSRVVTTRIIGEAIARSAKPPKVWLNSSTATIYRHAEDRPQDEFGGEIGSGFSVNVATAWEKTFFRAPTPPSVRKVALRSAMVMGRGHGGPFSVFHTLVRLRLGGRMGPGTQYVSWIHIEDFCRAVEFLVEREDLCGCFNLSAPDPLPNAQFMRELRAACGISLGLPAATWMLSVGAFIIRTETELPLKSRWVVPTRLLNEGFEFKYPTWSAAAAELVSPGWTTSPECSPQSSRSSARC